MKTLFWIWIFCLLGKLAYSHEVPRGADLEYEVERLCIENSATFEYTEDTVRIECKTIAEVNLIMEKAVDVPRVKKSPLYNLPN